MILTDYAEHIYDRYACLELLEFAFRINQPGYFLYDAVKLLMQYDMENHTEYLKDLQLYLASNCDAKQLANRLGIHRNTIYYRLSQIESIANIHLKDQNTIFQLQLSIQILQYTHQIEPV